MQPDTEAAPVGRHGRPQRPARPHPDPTDPEGNNMLTAGIRTFRKAIILACDITAELTTGITDTALGTLTHITTALGRPAPQDPPTHYDALAPIPPFLPPPRYEAPPPPTERNWTISLYSELRDGDIALIRGGDAQAMQIRDNHEDCGCTGHSEVRHVYFKDLNSGAISLVSAPPQAPLLIAPAVPDALSAATETQEA